jgi:hypothetical protein
MPQNEQCATCKHYRFLQQCAAYPKRIPQPIFDGFHDHREPYKGDQGIRWEPAEQSTDSK